jgi:hypothetical protein
MRLAGASIFALAVAAASCAGRKPTVVSVASVPAPLVAGIWDGMVRATISEGMGSGDTRIEKQEWHLTQAGGAITGYYIAALTFVSGDGRPYVCSRQPQFSAVQRYDVRGNVHRADGGIDLEEIAQQATEGRCDPGSRRLLHYEGKLKGDVLTLVVNGQQKQTLYRSRGADDRAHERDSDSPAAASEAVTPAGATAAATTESPFPSLGDGPKGPLSSGSPSDVSGLWIWEHQGNAPGGDQKQEREEWHVNQEGAKITGYYDRIVRQVSADGHAYRCSMSLEFEIATRYRINGEVRGNQVIIYENSFEILEPNACDNGKRRLDAYEGQAAGEEIRLVWGVGGQVLRRPRPDVPTQRF